MENDVIDSVAVTEEAVETDKVEAAESNDPQSMLEAIQNGLKQDEPEAAAAEPEPEPEPEPEVAPEAEAEAAPENEDDPPEGISKKAQERFRNIVSKVKEKEAELTSVRSDLDGIRTLMKDTGGTPEDFSRTFEYIRAVRSGDFDNARSILEDQIRQLSVATGKPFGQVDPLSQFPDLRERVNAYQMDEPTALEIARSRSNADAQRKAEQQFSERQNQERQSVQARQSAIAEIDRLGAEWAKSDPDYAVKEGIITQRAQEIAAQFPPSQWAAQVKLMYSAISSMPVHKPAAPSPAPLRASGQSAGARQPTNMLEALQSGLGYGN
ncbi:hypothetical protein [Quatrionicoccus australiensis]|uniref:hypothetical protein n=1 Tax=Quatrionicoccus australiensis TaxID=138118 RepID=UPI001CFC29F4|nr:hypothetical protein [Quatrionicoccus australiensis]MCB4358430.1 hypothetical protein [Quatrionicoccus australiensis]